MLLDCQNISKSFADTPVLSGVSFQVNEGEKLALVGTNGAGKTTLLNILSGTLAPDEGIVVTARDKTLGYLKQNATVESGRSVYEELLSARQDLTTLEARLRDMEEKMASETGDPLTKLINDYDTLNALFVRKGGLSYQSEILGTLRGLGFSDADMERPVDTLSGGQKTRLALSRLLTLKPDLLILDEPTNHLDLSAIAFLETALLTYKGSVLVVSHDRYFLDRVAQRIIELENTKANVYTGNYSEYAVKKEARRNELLNAYYKQQEQIAHEEAVIKKLRQFNREKSIRRAESRIKKLARIKRLEKPAELRDAMSLSLMPKQSSGKDVLTVKELSMRFGAQELFSGLSFSITRGEHIALIGDNGTGKTTLLKIINELLAPTAGELRCGTNVEIAYYDQEQQVLHPEKTLFDELQDDYPAMSNTEIRNALAAFLFTGDDAYKTVGMLSGGEKGRVSLCKLMLSGANFLILDEPTNHLDLTSKEILEDALNSYEGTVLYVSHDRYFINRTASRILELHKHTLTNYLGDFDDYLEKKAANSADPGTVAASDVVSQGALDYKAQKEEAAAKRKRENELKRCEDQIAYLEEENKRLDREMTLDTNAVNSVKLQELAAIQNKNRSELDTLYALWETLA